MPKMIPATKIVFLLGLLILITILPAAKADYVAPLVLKNAFSPSPNELIHIAQLDDQRLVLVDGSEQNAGLYVFNTTANAIGKIADFGSPSRPSRAEDVETAQGNNGLLIDILGEVYFTKGTQQTTAIVGSFGTAEVGGAVSIFISNLSKPLFHQGYFYFHEVLYQRRAENPNSPPIKMWRTRGSAQTLESIQIPEGFTVKRIMPSPKGSGVIIFGRNKRGTTDFLELLPSTRRAIKVAGFEQQTFDPVNGITIISDKSLRRGLIFCRSESIDGDRPNTLWRLGRNFELVRLSDDCTSIYILGQNAYFFKGANLSDPRDIELELWQTNGLASETQGIINLDSRRGPGDTTFLENACTTDGFLAFSLGKFDTPAAIWRSDGSPDGTRKITEAIKREDNDRLLGCISDQLVTRKLIIKDESSDPSKLFDKNRALGIISSIHAGQSSTNKSNTVIVYTSNFDPISADIPTYQFVKLNIRKGAPLGYIPAVLNLLNE